MTTAENVALPITEYTDLKPSAIAHLVRMKLCSVDLGGYENHLPSELSGGMIKRAALALNPEILFLDEPTAGLDPMISAEAENSGARMMAVLEQGLEIVKNTSPIETPCLRPID